MASSNVYENLRDNMIRLQSDILKNRPDADDGLLVATAYQWLKAECDATLFRLQSEAIVGIGQILADLPHEPKVFRAGEAV